MRRGRPPRHPLPMGTSRIMPIAPQPSAGKARPWLGLAGFLAATFAVAGISGACTASAIPTWYATLAKPSFNPPNFVFAPVWTLLYFLMALAAWLVWKRPSSASRARALRLFWIQLALNFTWSFLFFGGKRIGLAFFEVCALWLAILFTTVAFFRHTKPAGWMFVPYLAWVTFASILNLAIWHLN